MSEYADTNLSIIYNTTFQIYPAHKIECLFACGKTTEAEAAVLAGKTEVPTFLFPELEIVIDDEPLGAPERSEELRMQDYKAMQAQLSAGKKRRKKLEEKLR